MEPRKIISEKLFFDIERISRDKKIDYIDAVIYHCEKNGIDIETIASIIKTNENMKEKLRIEAEDLNILPRRARLPI